MTCRMVSLQLCKKNMALFLASLPNLAIKSGKNERSIRSKLKKERIVMIHPRLLILFVAATSVSGFVKAQSANSCADLSRLKMDGVEITKAAEVSAGTTLPPAYPGAPAIGPVARPLPRGRRHPSA